MSHPLKTKPPMESPLQGPRLGTWVQFPMNA